MLQKIYNSVSPNLQNIGISLYGYYWKKRRFAGRFKEYLKEFNDNENLSPSQIKEKVLHDLQKLLSDAYRHVPYYNEIYSSVGLNDNELRQISWDKLNHVPCLDKSSLREYGQDSLLSVNRKKGKFYPSSGSTGTPVQIYFSADTHRKIQAAYERRVRNWAGVDRNNSRMMIGGRRVVPGSEIKYPLYRFNIAEQQVYASSFHITKESATHYIEALFKYDVKYIVGYAYSIYMLAHYAQELAISTPRLKAVLCSSEKLTNKMRHCINKVFGCKVYDGYSGIEACGLITENKNGELIASPDVGILEVIKSDGSYAKPGEVGELVCTGLLNWDQPLIRYKIRDEIRVSADNEDDYWQGKFFKVEEIIGRLEDRVVGKDGREMKRLDHIFKGIKNIIEGQIIQHSLDHFEIKYVTSSMLPDQEKRSIESTLKSQVGEVEITFSEVSNIEKSPSGKFKAVISKV